METNIHTWNRTLVKSFMEELKQILLFKSLLSFLGQIMHANKSQRIILQPNSNVLLFRAYSNAGDLAFMLWRHFPCFYHLASILIFEILLVLLFFSPKWEITLTRTHNETFGNCGDFCYWELHCGLWKHITEISFHLVVIAHWANDKKLCSISSHKDFAFVEPWVDSIVSILR